MIQPFDFLQQRIKAAADYGCFYDSQWHTFKAPGNRKLGGPSKIIREFKKPFDKKGVSEKMAAKRGCTPEEIIKEWEAKAEMGTEFHDGCDLFVKTGKFPEEAKHPECKVYWPMFERMHLEEMEVYSGVMSETVLFNLPANYGTILDLTYFSDNRIKIVDHKTNSRLYFTSFDGDKFFEPVQALDDCNFNEYLIELNLYRQAMLKYMAHYEGPLSIDMEIWHYTDAGVEVVPVPIQDELISGLIDAYRVKSY